MAGGIGGPETADVPPDGGERHISTLFYRLPRLTLLAILIVLIGGFGAMLTLPRQEDPTLVERYGFVQVQFPGADAERVETLVTRPLEAALLELPEVVELDSTSRPGFAVVALDLDDALSITEVDNAWTLVRSKAEQAALSFPAGASDPDIERIYLGATTLIVSLRWEGTGPPELPLMSRLAQDLEEQLSTLPNTEETQVFGLPEEEIRVTVDPAALEAAGLSLTQAAQSIAAADAKTPAGRLRGADSTVGLEVGGAFDGTARIRDVPLRQEADGSALRVADVATVEKGIADPQRVLALDDGARTVFVGAFISPNQRVDQWAASARSRVESFAQDVPGAIAVDVVFDQSNYTDNRLNGLAQNLMFSALIVVGVLFFIMGWRAAIVVGLALPLTLGLVLILFNVFGHPLHQMSVTGLVISLGLLIDNAIVVVDEFDQKRSEGTPKQEAIREALSHLAGPLFASTLTTVLAFLPIALLPGGAGEFVGMIGLSVVYAILMSFAVALTIIPALAGWLYKDRSGDAGPRPHRWWRGGFKAPWLTESYRSSVDAVLRVPALGLALGILPAIAGLMLATTLPFQFFPQTERDQFQIQMLLPSSATVGQAEETARELEETLLGYEGVERVFFAVGEPAPLVYYNARSLTRGVEGAVSGWVQVKDAATSRAIVGRVQADLRARYPQAQILALPFEQGPPIEAPIEFFMYGESLEVLDRLASEVRAVLSQTPGITYTSSSIELGAPGLTLEADEAVANMAGKPLSAIARDLSADLGGLPAGSVLEGTQEIPVRVTGSDSRRGDIAELGAKRIGAGTPLSSLGALELQPQVAAITRRDGRRTNQILAYLDPYTLPAPVQSDFEARLEASGFDLPAGYELEVGGAAAESGGALGNLAAVGVPMILVMAGAIALVFNSFRLAGLILSVGLLSIFYAFFGVWLFDLPLGFNAIIGALGLLGISINGSIVVLSLLKANPAARAGDLAAQRETVVAATRHIVATTLTTMGGFVPLLIEGDAFWMPLAAAISGGVLGSAILALYFTPAAYRLFTTRPISRRVRKLFTGAAGNRRAPAPAE